MPAAGLPVRMLDAEQTRARVASPTYLGAGSTPMWRWSSRHGWSGACACCLGLGVRIHERSPVVSLARAGAGVAVRTDRAELRPGGSCWAPTPRARCCAGCG